MAPSASLTLLEKQLRACIGQMFLVLMQPIHSQREETRHY